MDHPFTPHNQLEEQLLAAQQGALPAEELLSALMSGQLFMPIEDREQIAGFQRSTSAKPLLLTDPDSGESLLALFTSPERAAPVVSEHPGYGGGLLVDMAWIVERLGGVHPVTINPGWEVGIELDAAMISTLLNQPPGNH